MGGFDYDGHLYDANTSIHSKQRLNAKALVQTYNNTDATNMIEREKLIRKLIAQASNKFYIEQPFYCDYGFHISIGDNFYSNHNLVILDCAKVTIGDNVFIGPNVGIYAAGHPLDPFRRNQGLEYALPITIGNNVWIGGNVVILPGVNIGDNTTIGAGSVVTKNIPANSIAAGNPCKKIREISESDKIKSKY